MTKRMSICQAAAVLLFCGAWAAGAQDEVATGGAAAVPQYTSDALDQLLRPIALYPDPLLAEIFTAATLPEQIVMADRYVNDGGDLSLIGEQPWDPSLQALAHYPTVLKWLDDNLPWTTEVGQAFLYQQPDVMTSIQHLRFLAQGEGNLQSTPQENVVNDNGTVEIEPVNPEVIYVPTYPWDAIYFNAGVSCSFGVGFPIGIWLTHDWDWRNRHVIAWGSGQARPANWWSRPARERVAPRGVAIWHRPPHAAGGVMRGADRGWSAETFRPARRTAPWAPMPMTVNRSAVPSRGSRPGTAPGSSVDVIHFGATPPTGTRPFAGVNPSTGTRPSFGAGSPPTISRPAPAARGPSGGSASGRSTFGGGAFGGSESSFEARQSSVRGVESRGAVSAPSSARSSPVRSPAPSSGSSSSGRSSAPSSGQSSQSSHSSRGR